MTGPRFVDMADTNPDANVLFHPFFVVVLIFIMGLCGGLGMSNIYWRVSKKPLPVSVWQAFDKAGSKHFRQKDRTIDTQEDGVSTLDSEGDENSYFVPKSRMWKSGSSTVQLRGDQEALLQDQVDSPKLSSSSLRESGEIQKRSQEEETAVREFLVSTIALPDTVAIMMASIVSMWLQPELCRLQVNGGRNLCLV